MVDNENQPPEQDKPEKKLRLDLSEAMPHGFDEDDDDIIELKDEVSSPPQAPEVDAEPLADTDQDLESTELPAVENIIDLDALEDDDSDPENVIRISDDLTFEEEDEGVEDILPMEKEPARKADGHNDVVEITEFDDILSEDTSDMMTLSDISEELDIEEVEEEDEFLELIDVDEDEETEIDDIPQEVIQFDGPGVDIEDVELKDFISDSLDEEIQIDEEFDDDLVSMLGVESGEEMDIAEQASSQEDFDFSMDSSDISEKIDQLDNIFFDDMESETELEEEVELEEEASEAFELDSDDTAMQIDETEDMGVSGGEGIDMPLAAGGMAAMAASPNQIEETIEQIIERKFSGKIESMITQIIEKAVTKEIESLKKMLLEEDRDEDL